MTREEAIDLLSMIEFVEPSECCLNTWYKGIDDDMKEAIEMAIKALEQEYCADVISRQAALKQLKGCLTGGETEYNYVKIHIDNIPSVTPQPKTGHWILKTSLGYHISICSNCHWRGYGDTRLIYKPKYCPNCGTKMTMIIKESEVE